MLVTFPTGLLLRPSENKFCESEPRSKVGYAVRQPLALAFPTEAPFGESLKKRAHVPMDQRKGQVLEAETRRREGLIRAHPVSFYPKHPFSFYRKGFLGLKFSKNAKRTPFVPSPRAPQPPKRFSARPFSRQWPSWGSVSFH